MIANPSKIVASASSQQECEENIKKLQKALPASEFKELIELSQFLSPFPREMAGLMGNYLGDTELETSGKTMLPLLIACTLDMKERKWVREELLPPIFNADPQGIESLFNRKEGAPHPKILFTKAGYREGYFSQKLGQFVCFRYWRGVSAWQAAYLCGEGPFLGRKLLAYIIKDNKLSLPDSEVEHLLAQARQQLLELLNRIGANVGKESANNTATTTATKTGVAIEAAASLVATAVSNNDIAGNKEKAELCHGFSENADNEFSDAAEFLAPIKELLKAYNAYISQYSSLVLQNKLAEIDKLWEQVGECHKRLPQYVKQEFFGPIPFDPAPLFDTEPRRGECRYWNDDRLDLDKLGIGTLRGLYKAGSRVRGQCQLLKSSAQWVGEAYAPAIVHVRIDLAAVSRLCELREADLRNTVDCLRSLESACTLIAKVTTPRIEIT